MTAWTVLYEELEVLGQRRNKRLPTEQALTAFESDTGITLPKSYLAFAKVFGAGELCGYYRFHVPLGRKDEYDLATFNAETHGSDDKGCSRPSIRHFGEKRGVVTGE